MKLNLKEVALFALLGTLMFVSKLIMDILPNIHLLALFIVVFTVTYRQKALYPITVFIFLTGVYGGFSLWWIPYLYIWHILWAVVMLLPKKMRPEIAMPVYMIVAAMHGFLYGTLYAPFQCLAFGLSFDGMIAWIIAGLPWDFVHGVSNFVVGIAVLPLVKALKAIKK